MTCHTHSSQAIPGIGSRKTLLLREASRARHSTVSLCRESFPWPICIRQAMTDDVIGTSTEKHCTEDLFPVREVTIASEISKASEGARGFFPTRTNISRTWWISGEDRPSKVSRELIQRTMVDLEPEKSVSLDQFLDSGHFFWSPWFNLVQKWLQIDGANETLYLNRSMTRSQTVSIRSYSSTDIAPLQNYTQ